ncbi:MAG: hypothetical protein ACOC2K_02635 [Bacteroidota bacterium]
MLYTARHHDPAAMTEAESVVFRITEISRMLKKLKNFDDLTFDDKMAINDLENEFKKLHKKYNEFRDKHII